MHVEPFRLDSDRYPLKVRILARYADVDPLWHINNVAVAQYYEEARVSFRYSMAMFQDGACVSVSEAYRQRLEGWLIAVP